MLLHELSREQQRAFMVLARQVVAADERLALDEVERLDLLYREMQLPAADADDPATAGDLNLLFPDAKGRALVVLNLLALGYGDGALDERERWAVVRIAHDLRLDDVDVAAMETWAARHAALLREAERFWSAP
jgi:hypothetical protein